MLPAKSSDYGTPTSTAARIYLFVLGDGEQRLAKAAMREANGVMADLENRIARTRETKLVPSSLDGSPTPRGMRRSAGSSSTVPLAIPARTAT